MFINQFIIKITIIIFYIQYTFSKFIVQLVKNMRSVNKKEIITKLT
jgi:hypothetical protein